MEIVSFIKYKTFEETFASVFIFISGICPHGKYGERCEFSKYAMISPTWKPTLDKLLTKESLKFSKINIIYE